MRRLILPLAALALAACQPPAPSPADPAATADVTMNPLPDPPDATPIDASYACEGNRVDLINDRATARIAMNDGRVVSLGGMRGSTPETWRDMGLTFTIDGRSTPGVVELAQDNGPALRCETLSGDGAVDHGDAPLQDAGQQHTPDAVRTDAAGETVDGGLPSHTHQDAAQLR